MWLCEGKNITSDSEVQYLTTPRTSVQGGVHPTVTAFIRWSIDATARAMEGGKSGEVDAVNR